MLKPIIIKLKLIGITFIVLFVVVGIYSIISFLRGSSSPTQTYQFRSSSQSVIKQIRSLNRLETASYTIEKVIDAGTSGNSFQQFFYGDRILFIAHGEIIAGFNLSELTEDAAVVQGTKLTLTLPSPKILVTKLDNDQSRVYDRKQGLLTKGDTQLESQARLEAERVITEAACQGKILDEASTNAKTQLTTLFKALGFTEITIIIPQGSC